ncbi:MAG: CvpA family protein [Rikenellaceae bacterium]
MNIIDIIILAILGYSAFLGIREGLIVQGLSIIGIGLGLWFGSLFGGAAATLFGIKGDYASLCGFLIVTIAVMIGVATGARILQKVLSFVGFGLVDKLLGGVLSVVKVTLILSVAFVAFDLINQLFDVVDHKIIEGSMFYRPITNIVNYVAPAWDWTQQYLSA